MKITSFTPLPSSQISPTDAQLSVPNLVPISIKITLLLHPDYTLMYK